MQVELRIFFPDIILQRLEIQRLKMNQMYNSSISRTGMIKILVKEALGIREQSPESEKELTAVRKKFDVMWKDSDEKLFDFSGRGGGEIVEDLVGFVTLMGGVVHRGEVLERFKDSTENTVSQRIRVAVASGRLFRIARSLYADREIDKTTNLTESEKGAFKRIAGLSRNHYKLVNSVVWVDF